MRSVLSCLFLCATLGFVAAGESVGVCELDGFNLRHLRYGQFWNFSVPDPQDNCLHDFDSSKIAGCSVYFSICKPLPTAICGDGNASYCHVVTDTGGVEYQYVIGNYSTAHKFTALADGFSAIRYGHQYPNEQECSNSTFVTTINFDCDSEAKYNTNQPDISSYVSSAMRIPNAECIIVYDLKYSGACYQQPTLAPSHCSLTGFDTTAISTREYFKASMESEVCYNFDGEDCMILMSFCHPLPLDISENCRNPESAICQANKLEEADKSWSMGAYENYTRFYENVDTSQVGFHVEYSGGSNPGEPDCPGGLQTRVIFVCDKEAQWTDKDVSDYIELERDPCYYNIIAKYDGACYNAHNVVTHSSGDRTSIIGWVFIAIFLFGVLTYLVIGSAFQYCVRQERGFRVLPNHDLWRNFSILSLEGCKFSLDTITCHRFDGVPKKNAVSYDHL